MNPAFPYRMLYAAVGFADMAACLKPARRLIRGEFLIILLEIFFFYFRQIE